MELGEFKHDSPTVVAVAVSPVGLAGSARFVDRPRLQPAVQNDGVTKRVARM